MLAWILGIGCFVSFVGAVMWALLGVKRSPSIDSLGSLSGPMNKADGAMLSAVVSLVGDNDIDSAIEVLQLQRKRKNPPQ